VCGRSIGSGEVLVHPYIINRDEDEAKAKGDGSGIGFHNKRESHKEDSQGGQVEFFFKLLFSFNTNTALLLCHFLIFIILGQ
jgi:hypothetical protein